MTFAFIGDLCESKLLPSKTSLARWDTTKLAELGYLYFLGLRILLSEKDNQWARDYCKQAGEPNDYTEWRNNANDLYALLYAVRYDRSITTSLVRHWLRHVSTHEDNEATHRLFMRLDGMFKITASNMRSMRRVIMDWEDADEREQEDILTKLIQMIHSRAPSNSEIMPHLKRLEKRLAESASAGATGAANVATAVGGLGAGFDPDGHERSIYGAPKKKKPLVIRRESTV